MTGDSRLVISSDSQPLSADRLVGRRVYGHADAVEEQVVGAAGGGGCELHDGVLRLLGFTLLRGEAELLPLLRCAGWAAPEGKAAVATALERWLRTERRLIERRTGRPLRRAAFVRVDARGLVAAVEALATE